jgi:hypothetical protein
MLWWSTPFWWGSSHTCCAQLWQWQWVCKKYISEINIKILCMYLKLIHETVTLRDCFATNLPSFLPITITVVMAVKNSTSKVSVDF